MQGETEIIDTKIIGREPPADILLNHPSVSRQHQEVLFSGGGIMLRDLNSNNGTFVNGHRISDWTEVTDRDQIRFGGKRISPTVLDRWLLDHNDDENFFHQVVSMIFHKKVRFLSDERVNVISSLMTAPSHLVMPVL